MKPRALAWVAVAVTVMLLGVGNLLVWGPLWRHFHVSVPEIDAAVLQRHRQEPADRVLAVVADVSMMTDHPLRGDAAVAAARRILQGELALPFMPVLSIGDGFSPTQLEAGVPVQQVWIASLIVPDLLLRAHEHFARLQRQLALLQPARHALPALEVAQPFGEDRVEVAIQHGGERRLWCCHTSSRSGTAGARPTAVRGSRSVGGPERPARSARYVITRASRALA